MDMYVITGGSSGLGASLIRQLEPLDTQTVCLSRSRPSGRCIHIPADLSRPASAASAMASVFQGTSPGTAASVTLINNAGTLHPMGPAETFLPDQVLSNTSVNLVAPILLTTLFLSATRGFKGKRRIVNISSGAAYKTHRGWSLYCAAKAGLEQFARCVALEQETAGARVTIINFNPGVMDTPMQDAIRQATEDQLPSRSRFVSLHETGDLADPDLVAGYLIRGLNAGGLVTGTTYTLEDFKAREKKPGTDPSES